MADPKPLCRYRYMDSPLGRLLLAGASLAACAPSSVTLTRVQLGGARPALGAYYLVWPESNHANPALRVFRDWIATQTEDEDGLPR